MTIGKKIFYFIILIILVVLAFYVFQSLTKNSLNMGGTNLQVNPNPSVDDTDGATTKLDYKAALAEYKNHRIELNTACGAIPRSITVPNNGSIMIDNRASVDRVIKLDTYMNIRAYSFKIVKVSTPAAPMTWYLDCEKTKAVADILIQR